MLLAYIICALLMILFFFLYWLNKSKDMKKAEKLLKFADISCIAMSTVGIFSILFMVGVILYLKFC